MTTCLLTGSRVYGSPRIDSDVDLVVLVDKETAKKLEDLSDGGTYPVKFGTLNLILVTDERSFEVWKEGTEHLKHVAETTSITPTREQAIEYLNKLFESRGYLKLPKILVVTLLIQEYRHEITP